MEERGLALPTMDFYKRKLQAFRKFLVQIKKVQRLELLTGDEMKFYIESKYSKQKVNTFNCHARALRAFFNYQERSIYVYATKTNTFRTVYYSKETERILNVYRREVLKGAEKGPLLVKFHSQYNEPIVDSGFNTDMVYNLLSRKAKKIFGDNFRINPHKFRHTFATHFVINGCDPFSLRDLLGHTNIETTKIYVDMSPKDLKTKHAQHSIISNIENNGQADASNEN